ncbi:RT0821/Lpp0805 family surface protein [Methylocella sp.]|uniref:RT0821/Lpp0805 family surface protein n=1 Tax=Methylocella sp. TaxID=1978226 RepID=UPI003C140D69
MRHAHGLAACLALAAMAAAMGGCALSVPIGSFANANAAADDDATASIPAAPLERLLQPEDWRRAKAALSTALDPQGDGASVSWDNPQSGVKGSFAPTGKAYPSDAKVCRGFKTEVERKSGAKTMQGVACTDKTGEWTIAEIAPPAPDTGAKSPQAPH